MNPLLLAAFLACLDQRTAIDPVYRPGFEKCQAITDSYYAAKQADQDATARQLAAKDLATIQAVIDAGLVN